MINSLEKQWIVSVTIIGSVLLMILLSIGFCNLCVSKKTETAKKKKKKNSKHIEQLDGYFTEKIYNK